MTITVEQIITIVAAVTPSIVALCGCIGACAQTKKSNNTTVKQINGKMEEVRQEVYNTKEYAELKSQLLAVHKENRELKKKLNELLTKIDKIYRSNEE